MNGGVFYGFDSVLCSATIELVLFSLYHLKILSGIVMTYTVNNLVIDANDLKKVSSQKFCYATSQQAIGEGAKEIDLKTKLFCS